MLLNINTIRKYWHAGAGIDDPNVFDRYEYEMDKLVNRSKTLHTTSKKIVEDLWRKQLEIQ